MKPISGRRRTYSCIQNEAIMARARKYTSPAHYHYTSLHHTGTSTWYYTSHLSDVVEAKCEGKSGVFLGTRHAGMPRVHTHTIMFLAQGVLVEQAAHTSAGSKQSHTHSLIINSHGCSSYFEVYLTLDEYVQTIELSSTIAQALKTCADELPSYSSSPGNMCSSCSSRSSPVSYPRNELARATVS